MKHHHLLLLLLIPNFALADGGIPFFIVLGIWQIIFFVLIVLVEFIYLFKRLPLLTKSKIFKGTLLANLFSTFIGYLVLFFIRLPFQKCIFRPCGKPYTSNETINNILNIFNDPDYWWLENYRPLPLANLVLGHISIIVLLLSCFLVSWIFEYYVFNFIQKNVYVKKDILRAMFVANLISYGLFFAVPELIIIFELILNGPEYALYVQ